MDSLAFVEKEKQILSFLEQMETNIVSKYYKYCSCRHNSPCLKYGKPIGLKESPAFYFNMYNLAIACSEMKKDLYFLLKRRDKLVGEMRIGLGKIAGVIAYRLGKSQIIHSCHECSRCDFQCTSKLNAYFALRCAWEYVGIAFSKVPTDISRELCYTFLHRHTDQETLGLVFDMLFAAVSRKQEA